MFYPLTSSFLAGTILYVWEKKGTQLLLIFLCHQQKSLPTVVVVVKTHQRATGIDLKGVKMSAP